MGATLFELLLALILLACVLGIALPGLRSVSQTLAVRAARENTFGLFAWARAAALQHGGASVELYAQENRVLVRSAGGQVLHEFHLPPPVDLLSDGTPDPVTLRYDAVGIGRMMSRTITLSAGPAQAGLVVSSFGRVRRW